MNTFQDGWTCIDCYKGMADGVSFTAIKQRNQSLHISKLYNTCRNTRIRVRKRNKKLNRIRQGIKDFFNEKSI